MDIAVIQGLAGQPSMAGGVGDSFPRGIHRLPLFFAEYDMDLHQVFATLLGEFVLDGILSMYRKNKIISL
jgi:hypothetical protein